MFVKDFKHLSSPALNISRATPDSQLSFDSLHTTPLQPQFSSLHPLPYQHQCYQLIHFQHSSTFPYARSFQIFFRFIHAYFHHPTFIFQTNKPNNVTLLPSPLLGVTALNRGTSIYLTNLLGMFDILTQQEIAKVKPYICQSNCLNITINHC